MRFFQYRERGFKRDAGLTGAKRGRMENRSGNRARKLIVAGAIAHVHPPRLSRRIMSRLLWNNWNWNPPFSPSPHNFLKARITAAYRRYDGTTIIIVLVYEREGAEEVFVHWAGSNLFQCGHSANKQHTELCTYLLTFTTHLGLSVGLKR